MVDVGKRAGVSAMTVSRALKGNASIAEPTRRRIMEAVEALGYVLDQSAGSLSSGKTGFIAAIIPSINNSNFSETARGITEALADTDLQLLLGYTEYRIDREEQLIESMLRRRPEGIILTGGAHTDRARSMLLASGIPVVETWDMPESPIDQVVGFSNTDAMDLLVTTLADKGYRKFGFIGGETSLDTRGAQRRLGFAKALGRFDLPFDRQIATGVPPITMKQGGHAISELLQRWPDTEVAVCVSDLLAFGALMECSRQGCVVPRDIAIAGFGDYEIAAICDPGITTINVDCYGIGATAARSLLSAIGRQPTEDRPNRITPTHFHVVQRDSA
jgi:LacI family gluconate utilization system Gnt-I transcriptional repressor